MRGIYIFSDRKNNSSGVIKKIKSQCDIFSKYGIDCRPYAIYESEKKIKKLLYRIPFCCDNINWPSVEDFINVDFLYIRKLIFTRDFYFFIKKIKERNPNIKIYIEIPTYPYFKDMISHGAKNIPLYIRDMIGRGFIRKYINGIALVGRVGKNIWNIPTVQIKNGIDINSISIRNPNCDSETINVMCAANFAPYHGIDIFINGLVNYYLNGGNRNIHLYLAGSKLKLKKEFKIINKNEKLIGDKVHFLGSLNTQELSKVYDKCDLGIVTLGYSRVGLKYNSTLKSREYFAVGMPLICDSEIDVLDGKTSKYVLYTNYNTKKTNIDEVINFYDSLYKGKKNIEIQQLAKDIRSEFGERINLENTMKPIIDMINK